MFNGWITYYYRRYSLVGKLGTYFICIVYLNHRCTESNYIYVWNVNTHVQIQLKSFLSDIPVVWKYNIFIFWYLQQPHLCLFAVRDIKPGEEITYSYGDWDWQAKVLSFLKSVVILISDCLSVCSVHRTLQAFQAFFAKALYSCLVTKRFKIIISVSKDYSTLFSPPFCVLNIICSKCICLALKLNQCTLN